MLEFERHRRSVLRRDSGINAMLRPRLRQRFSCNKSMQFINVMILQLLFQAQGQASVFTVGAFGFIVTLCAVHDWQKLRSGADRRLV